MPTHEEVFDEIVKVAADLGLKPAGVARKCDVSPQRFFNWRRRGVPPVKVREVSSALDGVLLPHQIRPDLPGLFPVPAAEIIPAAA